MHADEDAHAAQIGRVLVALLDTDEALRSGDPLRAIHALTLRQVALVDALRDAVATARRQGITWQKIADSLGVTKAAAHQRFSLRGSGDDEDPGLRV